MRDSESDYILVMDMEYKRLTDFLGSGRSMLFVNLPVWLVSKVRDIMKLDIVRAGRSGRAWDGCSLNLRRDLARLFWEC